MADENSETEGRIVVLETKIAALEDLVNNRLDFSERAYYAGQVDIHTPAPEE